MKHLLKKLPIISIVLTLLISSTGFALAVLPENGLWGEVITVKGGNVGIGTANPATTLHVKGHVKAHRFVDNDSRYYADLDAGGNLGGNWNFAGNVGIGTASPEAKLDVNGRIKVQRHIDSYDDEHGLMLNHFSNKPVHIGKLNSQTGRLTVHGNVGIGTANPGAKLEVNGNITQKLRRSGHTLELSGYFK